MDEMYRMLGREHEADLAREALKWHRADRLRAAREGAEEIEPRTKRARTRVVGLLTRRPRVV